MTYKIYMIIKIIDFDLIEQFIILHVINQSCHLMNNKGATITMLKRKF